MSRTADITFCKIAVIEGVFNIFQKENRFARVDIREAIKSGKQGIKTMAERWPAFFNQEWCLARWDKFRDHVFNAPDDIFQDSCAFAAMCERIMADLCDEYGHNPMRMAMIDPIHDVTRLIHDFCDNEGKNFVAYERSDFLMNKLDEILEAK